MPARFLEALLLFSFCDPPAKQVNVFDFDFRDVPVAGTKTGHPDSLGLV